jgi:prepilin-type N-terminal cleavage/methylation domain-containing protein
VIGSAEMTNSRMTNEGLNAEESAARSSNFAIRSFELPSSFVSSLSAAAGHSSFRAADASAFTLVELLVVMAIIAILAGLVLAASRYVQDKGRRARAETEIVAISAALQNYKADNGIYPSDPARTELLDPNVFPPPADASLYLYETLSGDSNHDRIAETTPYFSFKPNQLSPADQTQHVTFIRDPFGNSYGYSTAKAANPAGSIGYNPTFDLWSTANDPDPARWIKNW